MCGFCGYGAWDTAVRSWPRVICSRFFRPLSSALHIPAHLWSEPKLPFSPVGFLAVVNLINQLMPHWLVGWWVGLIEVSTGRGLEFSTTIYIFACSASRATKLPSKVAARPESFVCFFQQFPNNAQCKPEICLTDNGRKVQAGMVLALGCSRMAVLSKRTIN